MPSLFIEELDKFKLDSDFQRKEFHAVIDAVHNGGGQIVATSNLGDGFLIERLGSQYGGGIVRRIMGPRGNTGVAPIKDADGNKKYPDPDPGQGGFYIDFWRSTIEQNRQIPLPEAPGFTPVTQKGAQGKAAAAKVEKPSHNNSKAHRERVVNQAAAGHASGLSVTSDGRQQSG